MKHRMDDAGGGETQEKIFIAYRIIRARARGKETKEFLRVEVHGMAWLDKGCKMDGWLGWFGDDFPAGHECAL